MYAAAYGSLDAMKMIVAAGADVKARNAFDATALHWCAHDLDRVRFLVAKGAAINARSKQGRTPLVIAASHDGASDIVKFLVEKGADISAADATGTTPLVAATEANDTASAAFLIQRGAAVNTAGYFFEAALPGQTALMNAAAHSNVDLMKMLLAKGADVNAVSAEKGVGVKNGPIAFGTYTPLLMAATHGSPEAVKLLLDAGAKVNARDLRGMTTLMLAIGTDRADVRVIRLLLEKGADPNIKSKLGESSLDWAKKMGNIEVMKALGIDSTRAETAVLNPADERKTTSPKEAVQKSLAILQRTSGSFFKEGGCISCHAQNLTGIAVSVARAHGLPVDEIAAAEQLKTLELQFASFDQVLLQRMDPPGGVDVLMYSVLHLAAEAAQPDRVIDPLIFNIAGEQRKAGNWHIPGLARPPMEDGDFSRTALSIRALTAYALPGRKAEFEQRVARAAAWLKSASPRTTEDRNMQLLGLKWANADRHPLDSRVKELIALQHPDGGWAQTADLGSDAYATGLTLHTLHEMGVAPEDAAYQRGVAYLLRTQLPDGTWRVSSRAPKFQPYFQSGFPYEHDQWISSSATAWASIALTYAVSGKPLTFARR
jgi:ankyrin repeat protein